jgi:hypothetical protein
MLDDLAHMFCTIDVRRDIKEIKSYELYCLTKLEYKLNMVTPLMAVEFMILNGVCFNEDQRVSLGSKNEKNCKSDSIYKLAKEIIDIIIDGKISAIYRLII